MEDEVFPILEWSFNRLRGCERPCFLYCCLYPEDHDIEREQLIDLFIYAQLIPRRDAMELERSDGHRILNKLVKVCLLEEAKSKRGVECVRMHDLIRDLALRITSGRYNSRNTQGVPMFLVKSSIKESKHLLVEKEELKDDLIAVSLMSRSYDHFGNILKIPPLMSPNFRNLSTLIINRAKIIDIPDSFLQHTYGLKVLNLEWCEDLRLLPSYISDMVNLTALLLGGCWSLESVPPLGKLKQLRILNLFRTKVADLPHGLEELANLERLYMSELRERVCALPEGAFTKLYRLQHLVMAAAVNIGDLRVLHERWPTHYKIGIVPLDVNNEFSENCYPNFNELILDAADLMRGVGSKNQLQLEGCNFQKGLGVVLPPENLHTLDLHKCSGLLDVFFHHWIDRSKDLYHLGIWDLEELKFVLNLSSPDDDDEGALRNLRVLTLWKLPNLVGVVNIGRIPEGSLVPPGTFSSLEELLIERCHGLKKLFSVQLLQQCLQNLKHLQVRWCYGVVEIVANNENFNGEGGEEEAIILQSSSSGHIASTSQELLLPKLQRLNLHDLPKLENVCGPTIMIGGEEPTRFELYNCPKLKRLPSFSSVKIAYEIEGSHEWWNSLEWKNPSDKDAVQQFFKSSGR